MINDRQEAQINAARAAAGKAPLNTQVLRQNPTLPAGVDWLKFWTEYEIPGAPSAPPPAPPPVDESEQVEPVKADDDSDDDDGDTYEDMTIAELRAEAEKRGLDHTGVSLKSDWVKLLENDDEIREKSE